MTRQGRIVQWQDERGFGFIEPDDQSQKLFVHISAFTRAPRRPQLHDQVSFVAGLNKEGKPCATRADLLAVSAPVGGRWRLVLGVLFLSLLMIATVAKLLPLLIFCAYFGVSALALAVYAGDKRAAVKGRWRTSERSLQRLALFGGWPGALIAQHIWHHKTKKVSFQVYFWISIALNLTVLGWLLLSGEGQLWLERADVLASQGWQLLLQTCQRFLSEFDAAYHIRSSGIW